MREEVLNAIDDGRTIVTANRRLARSLTRDYNAVQQARGLEAWETPRILTWPALLDELWQEFVYTADCSASKLNEWQELVLWERVIRSSPGSHELLQFNTTASLAQEGWALACQYRLDPGLIEKIGNEDARTFIAWFRQFSELCDSGRWIEYARVPDILRENIDRLHLPAGILLAGFDEFTPQQQEFFAACFGAGCSVGKLSASQSPSSDSVVRVPFPGPVQEVEAAARWARSLLESGFSGGIGVVVADLSSRRNAVERVFTTILDPAAQLPDTRPLAGLVNFSAGNSLSGYPIIRSALAILSLSSEENEWDQLSNLLRSPYLRGSDDEKSARALLDARMRKGGGHRVPTSHLRRLCHSSNAPLFGRAIDLWLRAYARVPGSQTAGEWGRTFSAILEAFGWPGDRNPDSTEFQALSAWTNVLSNFSSTDVIGGTITRSEAISLLRRLATTTMFQPETEDAAIQVLGTLEASGLSFDHLWIAGLHDEIWPGPANPNPFLPLRLQLEKAVPRCSPERELEFAAVITRRLLASGSHVVLSYPEKKDDRELAPSPLIASVPEVSAGELELWTGPTLGEMIHQSSLLDRLEDEKGPPLLESSWQRGGTRVFEHQSGCPFRAFAELRLGAEPLETPVPGLDPRERGILVHSVFEEIWTKLKTHAALCSCTDLPSLIRDAVRQALEKLEQNRGAGLPERFAALERRRLERIAAEWLELEKKRLPFEVMEPEEEKFAEVGGIRFKVKIDRTDRLPDGRELIIDYKTGRPNVKNWDTERPQEPQLPLYSTIHEQPLAGVLFAQIRTGEFRFAGMIDDDVVLPGAKNVGLREQIERWRRVLERLGSDFREGHAETDPAGPETCRYCRLECLCRISEFRGEV